MEAKRCSYRREEIRAVAKKCKHCRRWLNDMQSGEEVIRQETVSIAPTNTNRVNDGTLIIACWGAIVLEIVSVIQSYGLLGDSFISWVVSPIVNYVPEWLVVLVSGFLWILLFCGLRSFCRIKGIDRIPFIALICLVIGCYLCDLTACFIEDSEDVSVLFLLIIACPLLIASSVLEFIAGIKLCNWKITHNLGILFMVVSISPIVALIVELGLFGWESTGIISAGLDCLVNIKLLTELSHLFGAVEETEAEE